MTVHSARFNAARRVLGHATALPHVMALRADGPEDHGRLAQLEHSRQWDAERHRIWPCVPCLEHGCLVHTTCTGRTRLIEYPRGFDIERLPGEPLGHSPRDCALRALRLAEHARDEHVAAGAPWLVLEGYPPGALVSLWPQAGAHAFDHLVRLWEAVRADFDVPVWEQRGTFLAVALHGVDTERIWPTDSSHLDAYEEYDTPRHLGMGRRG